MRGSARQRQGGYGYTGSRDAVSMYLSQIGQEPLLTAVEEQHLAAAIVAGRTAEARIAEGISRDAQADTTTAAAGRAAADRFVRANLRLVVSVAKRYMNRTPLGLGELIQDGNIGLVQAVERFDADQGYRFSTYATWWIHKQIRSGIHRAERTVRLPAERHDEVVKVKAVTAKLAGHGTEVSDDDVATEAGMTVQTVRRARQLASTFGHVDSLDRPAGADGSVTVGGMIADDAGLVDDQVVDEIAAAQVLDAARSVVDDRAWFILSRRFGTDGEPAATYAQIGQTLGLSRERVRIIQSDALNKIRMAVHA